MNSSTRLRISSRVCRMAIPNLVHGFNRLDTKEHGGHLRSARVSTAEEQNCWLEHACLLTELDDCCWFNCLVPRAAFGIEEAQQFLKGIRIRGIPQKCALPPYLNQVLVLELVKVVRQRRRR